MPGPARITIELEPAPGRRGRWVTRTRVDGAAAVPAAAPASGMPMPAVALDEALAPEPREATVIPVAYEAVADCTCIEGWCDIDHANA
jgi:hypothetical protein